MLPTIFIEYVPSARIVATGNAADAAADMAQIVTWALELAAVGPSQRLRRLAFGRRLALIE